MKSVHRKVPPTYGVDSLAKAKENLDWSLAITLETIRYGGHRDDILASFVRLNEAIREVSRELDPVTLT